MPGLQGRRTRVATGQNLAEARLRTVYEDTRAGAAARGFALDGGPSHLARLDAGNPAVLEATVSALHDVVNDLAPVAEQHLVRAEVGTQA